MTGLSLWVLLASTSIASARPHVRVVRHVPAHRPATVIRVSPWSPHYVPAPRPGFVWITGRVVSGRYIPGYWKPATPAPVVGWIWVPGFWRGAVYVDGYWRPPATKGQVWVDGYYESDGSWVAGRYVSQAEYDAMMSVETPPVVVVPPPEVAPPPRGTPRAITRTDPTVAAPQEWDGADAPSALEPAAPQVEGYPSEVVGEVYTTQGPALITADGTLLDPTTLEPLDLELGQETELHAPAPH